MRKTVLQLTVVTAIGIALLLLVLFLRDVLHVTMGWFLLYPFRFALGLAGFGILGLAGLGIAALVQWWRARRK